MKNLKNKIENLGYIYKNELILMAVPSLIFIVLGIGLAIIFKSLIFALALIGVSLIYLFSFYYKYSKKEQTLNNKLIDSFISYFGFFRIYIANGDSVYLALNKTLEFAPNNIKPYIEGLISEIDKDKTITPFIRFAGYFKMKLIEDIMISIYEMIENGNNLNYINQFTSIFENFKIRVNKSNSERRFAKFDSFITTSLVGSGAVMIILVYGIINLIGEIAWVIN